MFDCKPARDVAPVWNGGRGAVVAVHVAEGDARLETEVGHHGLQGAAREHRGHVLTQQSCDIRTYPMKLICLPGHL